MKIRIKSKEQIAGILKSSQLAAQTLQHLEPHVVAGVTTDELNTRAAEFIASHGAIAAPLNYKGFPKETCISINEVICHGIPGPRKLKSGDILNIDVTTILDGYYGDTSRMYAVDTPPDNAKRLMKITEECMYRGIAEIKPGNPISSIAHAITQYAELNGYGIVDTFCGHGVGIEFHELPQIQHNSHEKFPDCIISEGMVFTVEPMINEGGKESYIDELDGWTAYTQDNRLSAQYEHTVAVTSNGVDILSKLRC